MRSRFSRFRATSGVGSVITFALILAGCTQATRHSNLMAFGTNTTFGIAAGKDVDVPTVTVGYKRQELVLMPLVANTKEDAHHRLLPCDIAASADKADHPCVLVGTRGDSNNTLAKDSYSVLASFGANFGGGVDSTGAKINGGLAQYFATGMAAQLLALSGGAAVVATGQAASSSSADKPSAAAVLAVVGGNENELTAALAREDLQKEAATRTAATQNAANIVSEYLAKVGDEAIPAEARQIDDAAGLGGMLTLACQAPGKACLAKLPQILAGRDAAKIIDAVNVRIQAKGGQ